MRVHRIEIGARISPAGIRALTATGAALATMILMSPPVGGAQRDASSPPDNPQQQQAEDLGELAPADAAQRRRGRPVTFAAPPAQQELQRQRERLAAELERVQAEFERVAAAATGETSPATNRVFKVFALKSVRAPEVARICQEVLSPRRAQIAVDERTNSLVVSTDELTIITIEQLINAIDKPATATGAQNEATETVRLRIVWVLDGLPEIPGDGRLPQPVGDFLNEDVARSLEDIGFRSPSVVAQQISTLTLNQTRETPFQFSVPVLVTGEVWQFQGSGHLRGRTGDDDYWLQFGLQIKQPNSSQQSQLMGSMVTPRGHYAILGTSTFVAPGPPVDPDGNGRAGGFGTAMENAQYQSAFVVYLDRARSVPGAAEAGDSAQPRRR